MQTPSNTPVSSTRYFHWVILGLVLLLGLQLRLRGLAGPSLWKDEIFTLLLATGRGQRMDSPFDKPVGVVMAPFATQFAGAPPWWRVWTGMASAFHPPLYYMLLRGWVDLFGAGDFGMRFLSVLFALTGIVVLFDIVRRTRGPWVGLCAAGLMSAAWAQIIMSQEVRSYTMLLFLSLLLVRTMVMIQIAGASAARLILLGLYAAGMMLTHYLAAGALAGMGLFALLTWRGRQRWGAMAALGIAAALVVAVWCSGFSGTYKMVLGEVDFMPRTGNPFVVSAKYLWAIPSNLTVSPNYRPDLTLEPNFASFALLASGIFVLTLVLPVWQFRRSPDTLLWWLWAVGSLALPLSVDLTHPVTMLKFARYVFLASPGLTVLATTPLPLPARLRWAGLLIPVILVASCAFGTETSAPEAPWKMDKWKSMAESLHRAAGPRDVLVMWNSYNFSPPFMYVVMNHYEDFSRQRVVFLSDAPLSPRALKELADAPRVWVVGVDPAGTTAKCFPGWTSAMPISGDGVDCVWQEIPPGK